MKPINSSRRTLNAVAWACAPDLAVLLAVGGVVEDTVNADVKSSTLPDRVVPTFTQF